MTKKRNPSPRVSLLLLKEREVGASEFKARCLEIMDEVQRLGVSVTITKHRKAVAKLVPVLESEGAFCGSLNGLVIEYGDLVSPIDVEWDADAATTA